MDPASLATIATVGSKVVSGVGSFIGSQQDEAAMEAKAKAGAIAAEETDAAGKNDLLRQLGNIRAVRASVNMSDSPTSEAIIDRERELGSENIGRRDANAQIQQQQSQMDIGNLRTMSYFGALGSGLDAYAAYQKV